MKQKVYRKMADTAFYYNPTDDEDDALHYAYCNALSKKNEVWKDGFLVAYKDIPCLEITPEEFKNWKGPKFSFTKETANG